MINPENSSSLHHSPNTGPWDNLTYIFACLLYPSGIYPVLPNEVGTQKFLTPGFQVKVSALPRGLPQGTKNISNYHFWLAHLTAQSQMKSNLEQDFKKRIKLTLTKEK